MREHFIIHNNISIFTAAPQRYKYGHELARPSHTDWPQPHPIQLSCHACLTVICHIQVPQLRPIRCVLPDGEGVGVPGEGGRLVHCRGDHNHFNKGINGILIVTDEELWKSGWGQVNRALCKHTQLQLYIQYIFVVVIAIGLLLTHVAFYLLAQTYVNEKRFSHSRIDGEVAGFVERHEAPLSGGHAVQLVCQRPVILGRLQLDGVSIVSVHPQVGGPLEHQPCRLEKNTR